MKSFIRLDVISSQTPALHSSEGTIGIMGYTQVCIEESENRSPIINTSNGKSHICLI